jgi:hypothetical protein
MSTRDKLIEAIAQLPASGTLADDIDALAIRLSSTYPQSGLTIDDIARRIETAFARPNGADAEKISRQKGAA